MSKPKRPRARAPRWQTVANQDRHRVAINLTISRALIAAIDKLAGGARLRSRYVEALVRADAATRGEPVAVASPAQK